MIDTDMEGLLDSIKNSELEAIALEKKNLKLVTEEISKRYGIKLDYRQFNQYVSERYGLSFNTWYKNEVEAKVLAACADIPVIARKHTPHHGPRIKVEKA